MKIALISPGLHTATHRKGWEEHGREPPVWQGGGEVESEELEELRQKVGRATLKFRHEVWIGMVKTVWIWRHWWSDEGGGARDEREAKQGGRAEAVALKWVVEKKSAAVTSHTIVLQRSQCLSAACHHPTHFLTPPIPPTDTIRPQGAYVTLLTASMSTPPPFF
ncbi:hypothetical protein DFH08DRAFT_811907 [Mycena albidolilacea]|uniref:Uncharacterized protein n=1 Tax=Mycena albidolilacea TaxID=1033008 RepID=A0AAD6ZVC4_9AGAR|nr:hypothetical protein DFH08DRAFT_811907 [Mycena albidolilacea]